MSVLGGRLCSAVRLCSGDTGVRVDADSMSVLGGRLCSAVRLCSGDIGVRVDADCMSVLGGRLCSAVRLCSGDTGVRRSTHVYGRMSDEVPLLSQAERHTGQVQGSGCDCGQRNMFEMQTWPVISTMV